MNKKIIIIVSLILLLICTSNFFVTDSYSYVNGDLPYESNKNFKFSLDDVDGDQIKNLYDLDNTEIPSYFNLKDLLKEKYDIDLVAENQGSHPLCDLYSSIKTAETNYALKNGTYIDLSESYFDYLLSNTEFQNLTNLLVYDNRQPGEAIAHPSTMQYMEIYGAPTELEVPDGTYEYSEDSIIGKATPALRVTGTVSFPNFQYEENEELKSKWINVIKAHIMKYGALETVINAPAAWSAYNSQTYSQNYKKGISKSAEGHAVVIVGWDDNFPKSNFSIEPENDGAFIILNSYGPNWGDGGYFYISYEDDNIFINLDGVISTEIPEKYNYYSNVQKTDIPYSGFLLTLPWENHEAIRYYGIKLTKKTDAEYLKSVAALISGETKDYSEKVRIYLNPTDDSFDKNKLILLEETNSSIFINSNIAVLNNPVKIEGEKFAIVFEILGDEESFMLSKFANKDSREVYGTMHYAKSFDDPWKQTLRDFPVYISTISSNVSVVNLAHLPNKVAYIKGEQLDLAGGILTVTYEDGTIVDVPLNSEKVEISGYDSSKVGTQQVEVNYMGTKTGFNVNVKNDVIEVNIKKSPNKVIYIKGEQLDLTGGSLNVKYEDGTITEIPLNSGEIEINGYNPVKEGIQQIEVKYKNYKASFNIEVKNELLSINIKQIPNKVLYIKGEQLDLTGGILSIKYEDGTKADIPLASNEVEISGFDPTKEGNQVIEVKYRDKKASFNINVINSNYTDDIEESNMLSAINIKKVPNKVEYKKGESLDLIGGVLNAIYEDGKIAEVPLTSNEVKIIGYDSTKEGNQQIEVNYEGKTTYFNIIVKNSILSIDVHKKPNKEVYKKGESLDLTGGFLSVKYEDGSTVEIPLTSSNVEIIGYDSTKEGKQNVEVKYKDKTSYFTINVKSKEKDNTLVTVLVATFTVIVVSSIIVISRKK